jgi:hypothetical protein
MLHRIYASRRVYATSRRYRITSVPNLVYAASRLCPQYDGRTAQDPFEKFNDTASGLPSLGDFLNTSLLTPAFGARVKKLDLATHAEFVTKLKDPAFPIECAATPIGAREGDVRAGIAVLGSRAMSRPCPSRFRGAHGRAGSPRCHAACSRALSRLLTLCGGGGGVGGRNAIILAQGLIRIETAGEYNFTLESDDGAQARPEPSILFYRPSSVVYWPLRRLLLHFSLPSYFTTLLRLFFLIAPGTRKRYDARVLRSCTRATCVMCVCVCVRVCVRGWDA